MYKEILTLLLLINSTTVLAEGGFVGIENGYGKGVKVAKDQIELNKSFLKSLAAKPSLDLYDVYRWELQYLVNVGNRQALSIGIELLSQVGPEQIKVDDDHGIRLLAATISDHPDFWVMLRTKPHALRKKVVYYYDVNRCDYFGHDYEDEKARTLTLK